MKPSSFLTRAAIAAGALALTAGVALASTAPTPNKGDTAWMLVSTALVLFMTIPGLALFYGGLVRTKNMASVLTQVFAIVCIAAIFWVTIGYSLAFTNGGSLNDYIGGFSKAFLAGVTPETVAATFSNGVVIPELTYVAFQMTFACITPALIVGAFAERVKFSALMLFTILFLIFIYAPIAHMVWYWAGPDALGDAAKAVAEAGTDAAKKAAAEAKLAAVTADAGIIFQWGALDFAGGTVVHINAGVAGLVGCYVIGKRIGFGKELMAPHSLTLTMVGAAMLFVGWFGFNAGSNLEANGVAALAMMNTFVAAVAGGCSSSGRPRASPRCWAWCRVSSPVWSPSHRRPAGAVRWAAWSSARSQAWCASSSAPL
jgi:ammonium transporter, Amt family